MLVLDFIIYKLCSYFIILDLSRCMVLMICLSWGYKINQLPSKLLDELRKKVIFNTIVTYLFINLLVKCFSLLN